MPAPSPWLAERVIDRLREQYGLDAFDEFPGILTVVLDADKETYAVACTGQHDWRDPEVWTLDEGGALGWNERDVLPCGLDDDETSDTRIAARIAHAVATWQQEVGKPRRSAYLAKQKRIGDAVRDAQDAFWASLAASFPEVTTGDIDPHTSNQFDTITETAARRWLDLNDPR